MEKWSYQREREIARIRQELRDLLVHYDPMRAAQALIRLSELAEEQPSASARGELQYEVTRWRVRFGLLGWDSEGAWAQA